jgi:dTDP-glucose 4,6-dehydratase
MNKIHDGLHPVIKNDLDFILAASIDDLNALAGSLIFITGGTGFFGKWLLQTISRYNNEFDKKIHALVLSRNPESFIREYPEIGRSRSIEFVIGDVINFDYNGRFCDFIVHAAADATYGRYNASTDGTHDPIVLGALNIVKFAIKSGAKRLLFTSSGAVYGALKADQVPVSESHPMNVVPGLANYGRSKLLAEDIILNNNIFEAVIARCFSFCGPYLPLNGPYAFGNFVDDVLNKRTILVNGNGKSIRSYLYASDLAVWLFRLLLRGINGGKYNVGSPVALSICDLAKMISGCSPGKIPWDVLGKNEMTTSYYVPNVDKARIELGLSVSTSIDQAIIKTIAFYGGL